MRFLFPFLLAALLCPVVSQAQVGGGISVAGIASQIDGDQWGGYNKLGFHFGGFARYDFSDYLALQIELLYSHRGSREVVDGYGQIAIDYIDVPLLLRLRLLERDPVRLYGETGPSGHVILRVVNGIKPFKLDVTDFYHRFTGEYNLGIAAYFPDRFGVFARWSVGFTNLWAATPRPWLTIHYFSLGFRLAFS